MSLLFLFSFFVCVIAKILNILTLSLLVALHKISYCTYADWIYIEYLSLEISDIGILFLSFLSHEIPR